MNVFAECLTDCAINACSVTHLHSHQNVGLYLLFVQVRDVVFVHNNLTLADISSWTLTAARKAWSGLKLTQAVSSDCDYEL